MKTTLLRAHTRSRTWFLVLLAALIILPIMDILEEANVLSRTSMLGNMTNVVGIALSFISRMVSSSSCCLDSFENSSKSEESSALCVCRPCTSARSASSFSPWDGSESDDVKDEVDVDITLCMEVVIDSLKDKSMLLIAAAIEFSNSCGSKIFFTSSSRLCSSRALPSAAILSQFCSDPSAILAATLSKVTPNTPKLLSSWSDKSSIPCSIWSPLSSTLSVHWSILRLILLMRLFGSRVRSLDPNKEWLCSNSSAVALSLGLTRKAWMSQVRNDANWSPGNVSSMSLWTSSSFRLAIAVSMATSPIGGCAWLDQYDSMLLAISYTVHPNAMTSVLWEDGGDDWLFPLALANTVLATSGDVYPAVISSDIASPSSRLLSKSIAFKLKSYRPSLTLTTLAALKSFKTTPHLCAALRMSSRCRTTDSFSVTWMSDRLAKYSFKSTAPFSITIHMEDAHTTKSSDCKGIMWPVAPSRKAKGRTKWLASALCSFAIMQYSFCARLKWDLSKILAMTGSRSVVCAAVNSPITRTLFPLLFPPSEMLLSNSTTSPRPATRGSGEEALGSEAILADAVTRGVFMSRTFCALVLYSSHIMHPSSSSASINSSIRLVNRSFKATSLALICSAEGPGGV